MLNLKKQMVLRGAAALTAVVLLAGCETSHHDERSEGRVVDDKQLSEHVKKALDTEPVYKFTDVNVSTFGGIVQLSGFVNIDDQKSRAGEVTARVPGVIQVENGIALKPAPMSPTGRTNE